MGTKLPEDTATSAIFILFCLFQPVLLCFCQENPALPPVEYGWVRKSSKFQVQVENSQIVINVGPIHCLPLCFTRVIFERSFVKRGLMITGKVQVRHKEFHGGKTNYTLELDIEQGHEIANRKVSF